MGFDSRRTGTPDNANGIQIAMQPSQADANEFLPVGIAGVDLIGNAPSAHRSSVTTADTTTDMSSFLSSGTIQTDNRAALIVWADFSVSSGAVTIRLVYGDDSGNALAVGRAYTLAALSGYRLTASGNYMSEPLLIETGSFRRVKAYVESITSSTTANVFVVPV